MGTDKPARRMTLRQQMTYSEKYARDLVEQVHATLFARLADFRDLSRPVRRRSHYPTLLAMANALNKLEQASKEAQDMADHLQEHLQEIREHAQRERVGRR